MPLPHDRPSLESRLPAPGATSDDILAAFLGWTEAAGITLYPAQEEAILELYGEKNVILNTPTGSGKSLVATALHFKGLAEKKVSFYTSPIKALVTEKFFQLCRELGPDNVGMMTGDATVNHLAPVVCCTAEILASLALRQGDKTDVDYVIMDEFHYYSDKERGVAWQVPLLTLPQAKFLLMSATLGDMTFFETALTDLTKAPTVTVRSTQRPVPLEWQYRETPLHETVHDLVTKGRAPVYLVSFTQRGAAEEAQNLLSQDYCTKDEKKRIAEAITGVPFSSPYGKEVQKLLKHGIGIHHAGLLPRYRLLVEKLAQKGMLKVICGTDTLGVGVNIPLRTVLFTKLCKYDGEKTVILPVRDFQQIAGRAGRAGYDVEGTVVAQAPEHVIENLRLEAKISADPAKKKKIVKKKPPEWGYVHWDRSTFERLRTSPPEPLQSRFQVTHGMLLDVLGRPQGGCRAMKDLVRRSHESKAMKKRHGQTALSLLRSLWQAGIVELVPYSQGGGVKLSRELQVGFSLHHALGLWLVDAVERLDREAPTYALDVVTLAEAICEDPDVVLRAQVDKRKGNLVNELKAQGVEYEERMAQLEKVEHPKPNEEFLRESYELFAKDNPWVRSSELRPKSIARELVENFQSFTGYIKQYGLARSEGVLLRYLTEVYKVLVQTVPAMAKTPETEEAISYLGAMVRGVDASLLEEWERMRSPDYVPKTVEEVLEEDTAPDITRDEKVFTVLVRNAVFSLLRAFAHHIWDDFRELLDEGASALTNARLDELREAYAAGHGKIRLDPGVRGPTRFQIKRGEVAWEVTQMIVDENDDDDGVLQVRVDLARSRELGVPALALVHVG